MSSMILSDRSTTQTDPRSCQFRHYFQAPVDSPKALPAHVKQAVCMINIDHVTMAHLSCTIDAGSNYGANEKSATSAASTAVLHSAAASV